MCSTCNSGGFFSCTITCTSAVVRRSNSVRACGLRRCGVSHLGSNGVLFHVCRRAGSRGCGGTLSLLHDRLSARPHGTSNNF